MDYVLTAHARDALTRRGIELAWVEHALSSPERCEPDTLDEALEHRLAVVPAFGNRVLRVIVNIEAEPPRVITAFFDRRLRGPL